MGGRSHSDFSFSCLKYLSTLHCCSPMNRRRVLWCLWNSASQHWGKASCTARLWLAFLFPDLQDKLTVHVMGKEAQASSRTIENAVVQHLLNWAKDMQKSGANVVLCQRCIHPQVKGYLLEQVSHDNWCQIFFMKILSTFLWLQFPWHRVFLVWTRRVHTIPTFVHVCKTE